MTEDELMELARQLSRPDGEMGLEVGRVMDGSNIEMTLSAIESLELKDRDVVLEIGHGNASHLNRILGCAKDLRYHGLEISETMKSEAEVLNQGSVDDSGASFHLYDGQKIPFEEGQFDKIMSVNTLYFWEQPLTFTAEIARVLRPGGKLVLSYSPREFMQHLPFTKYGFRLYGDAEVQDLIKTTQLRITEVRELMDEVQSKSGEMVKRDYRVVVATKS